MVRVAEILLSALPELFYILLSSLKMASSTNNLTSEVIGTQLLQAGHCRNNDSNMANWAHFDNRKKPNKIVCSHCKKVGHIAKQCYKKRKAKNRMSTLCLLQPTWPVIKKSSS